MTDKVQRIREVIEKRFEYWREKEFNSHSIESEIRMSECKHLLLMVNSLQEELVSEKKCILTKNNYTDEERKVLCEDCKEKCEYSKKEEPVSEELEEAAKSYSNNLDNICGSIGKQTRNAFKAGAKWQEAKDQETIETAIHHAYHNGRLEMKERMMDKSIEAVVSQVPCSNEIILYNPSSVDKYYLPQEMNKLGLNKGDKVKLVIIKED